MKQYFDDLDEALEEIAIKQLDLTKTQGFNAVKKLIGLPNYVKMGYRIESVSETTVQSLLNGEIKIMRDFANARYSDGYKNYKILYRTVETRKDVMLIIETFFFNID